MPDPNETPTPDVVEMVNPIDGSVHAVTGGPEEMERLQKGWVYKDPDQMRPIGTFDPMVEESNVDLVPATNVRQYLRTAEGQGLDVGVVPRKKAVETIFAKGDQKKIEQLKEMGFLTGLTTVADDISFGAGPALREAMAPEINDVIQDAQAANPDVTLGSHIGAMVIPALIPGGQATSAGRAGILARLGSQATRGLRGAGPIGLSVQLGAKTEASLAKLLSEMAVGDGILARSAPAVAREIVEGTTASVGAGFTLSQMSDAELTAEEMLGDAAFGAALGLGFRGLIAGGAGVNRLRKRFQQSHGSRLFNEARMNAMKETQDVDLLTLNKVIDDFAEGRIPETGSAGSRMYSRVLQTHANLASVPSGVRADALRVASAPPVRKAYREARTVLPSVARELETKLDLLVSARKKLTSDAFEALGRQADDMLENATDSNASVLARNTISDGLLMMRNTLDDAIQNPAAYSQGMEQIRAMRQAVSNQLDRIEGFPKVEELDILDAAGNPIKQKVPTEALPTQRELFDQMRDMNRNVRELWRSTPKGNSSILGNDMVTKLRHNLLRNEDAFGEMAKLQARLDDAEGAVKNTEKHLMKLAGSKDPVTGDVVPDADKILREVTKMANNASGKTKLEQVEEALDVFAGHARAASEATQGALSKEADDIQTLVDTMKKDVVSGKAGARAVAAVKTVLGEENQASGFMQAIGFGSLIGGTGGEGIGVDPVTGMFLGALGGAAIASLVRPAGFYPRLTATEGVLNSFRRRLSNGKSGLVSALKGKAKKVARPGPAAGVLQAIEGTDRERLNEYERIRDDIKELVQDPNALQNRLATSTAGLDHDNPAIAGHVQAKSIMGLQYLATNLPVEPTDPLTGRPSLPPSMAAVDDFMRRYKALEDPLSILDDAASNRLHLSSVEAVRTVYPRIYQEVSVVAQEAIEEAGPDVPYASRIQLSTLMGFEAHPTQDPSFLAAMASPAAQTPQQEQAQRGTERTLNVAAGTKTEAQDFEE